MRNFKLQSSFQIELKYINLKHVVILKNGSKTTSESHNRTERKDFFLQLIASFTKKMSNNEIHIAGISYKESDDKLKITSI